MKNFVEEKKIGPVAKSEIQADPVPGKQRFAPVPVERQPGSNPGKETDIFGFEWQRYLPTNRVREIQKFCGSAMTSWGYKLLESSDKQDHFVSRETLEI